MRKEYRGAELATMSAKTVLVDEAVGAPIERGGCQSTGGRTRGPQP